MDIEPDREQYIEEVADQEIEKNIEQDIESRNRKKYR